CGATMGYFGVDENTLAYFRMTGRDPRHVSAIESDFKAQDLFGVPRGGEIDYSQVIGLDLASVAPSLAGPKRPQDRIDLPRLKSCFRDLFEKPVPEGGYGKPAAERARRPAVAGPARDVGHGDVLIA